MKFVNAQSTFKVNTYQQLTKLIAADITTNKQFGSALAVSGNYAVVGAADIPGGPAGCNCAYIFEKTNGNWIQKQKIVSSDNIPGNNFGHSVAISRNTIIIGAPNAENNSGAAYIFKRNTSGNWIEEKKIVAPDRGAGDLFGTSVSITPVYDRGDESYAVIGSPGDADFAAGWPKLTGAGSAYFFSNLLGYWEVLNKAFPIVGTYFDRNEGAGFGSSVSISGTYAVIGAPFEKKDTTGSNSLEGAGAAYVFQRNPHGAFELLHKIVNWDRAAGDQFGFSVSMNGDKMVIGAPFEDEDARQESTLISAGSAYVFQKMSDGRWYWTDKLITPARMTGDNFGNSVCISGDMIIVGAVTADVFDGTNKLNSGAAYLFKLSLDSLSSGWRYVEKIISTDIAASDWFGYAVGIDNSNIMVSSPFHNNAGAIYSFGKKICTPSTSSISPSICKTYTSPSKKYTWTRSGTYKDTLLNKAGCDSIITINLTITNIADTLVTKKGHVLTANAKDATYNWIDCATNQPINVTTRSLIVTVNGSYKVTVDQNGCVGTSSCHNVVVLATPDSTPVVTTPPVVIPRNASSQKAFLEVNKIVAQDRTHNDEFGRSVSISGNYAIVGAPYDDEDEKGGGVRRAGSAYIFKLDDGGKWKQLQKISAFDRMPGAEFGCAVAISGNYLVVGANRDHLGINGLYYSNLAGSAYVYRLNNGTWQFMQKIIANPTARVQNGQAYFGTAVAIDGNTIVVAAPDHTLDVTDKPESNVSSAGALFVYMLTNEGWIQTQKLVSKDRQIGDGLGNSVAICGDNIIAGSWGGDYDGMYANRMEAAGAAYIFERKGGIWSQTQKIAAEDRSPYDEFGFSVGISGNYAVVGARRVTFKKGDDAIDDYTGNAYVFKRGGDGKWVQQMKINPDDRTKEDNLGNAVGISGDYLIVSAMKQDTDSLGNYMPDAGAIYVYYLNKNGDWILSDKISPFYKHQLGNFGAAAAICDCNIIGTSWIDQTDEEDKNAISNTGAGFIFTATGCNNNGKCNASFFPQDKIPRDFQIKDSTSNSKMPQKVQSSDMNGKGNDVKIENQVITDESLKKQPDESKKTKTDPVKKIKNLLKKN